jgi:hypothetical protein
MISYVYIFARFALQLIACFIFTSIEILLIFLMSLLKFTVFRKLLVNSEKDSLSCQMQYEWVSESRWKLFGGELLAPRVFGNPSGYQKQFCDGTSNIR